MPDEETTSVEEEAVVPAAEPVPVESEPTPAPPDPVLARATISFVMDDIDMTPDQPRELPRYYFDRLAGLGLVERA